MSTIRHKICHGEVKRMTGGRLWCTACQREVDAVECYYESDGKDGKTRTIRDGDRYTNSRLSQRR